MLIGFLLLVVIVITIYMVPLIFTGHVWHNKKHGLKHTITDSAIITEWDFESPITLLKLLNLFIQCEDNNKQRNKYIRHYNRMKVSLKKEGYDVSDFQDYKVN